MRNFDIDRVERRRTWDGRVYRIRDVYMVFRDGTRHFAGCEAAYHNRHGEEGWTKVEEGSEYACLPVWDLVRRVRWPVEQWQRAA
jgi:hypothetical protein